MLVKGRPMMMKYKLQAKIDVNRNRNDKTPLRVRALLVKLIIQHQRVDSTFHFLPTMADSMSGAVSPKPARSQRTTMGEQAQIKHYIREMHDIENRNNNKTYMVFSVLTAIIALGMMKKNDGLFLWLRNNIICLDHQEGLSLYHHDLRCC
jgi:hypothetical protein